MINPLAALRWLRSPYAVLDRRLARGELTFRMQLPVLGSCLVTGDPALIAEVARNRELVGGRGTSALLPVVGEHSLIVLEGAAHEAHRAVLLPIFFTAEPARHDAINRRWVDHELARRPTGSVFSGHEALARITLDVIVEIMFGPLAEARRQLAVRLIEAWLQSFRHSAVLFLKWLQLDLGARSPWGRFMRGRAALHVFVREEMARVRAERPSCALTAIVEARPAGQPALGDDEVVAEVISFLLFGHDTSAAAMAWVLNDVLRRPEVLARVRAEAAACGEAAAEDPQASPYLRSVIQESMRLSPVVVHLTRHATAATRVGPHAVGEGERVLPCTYLAQRNPAVFERALQFLPERFLAMPAAWRHAYFPFGLGTRLCAGMPLALRQMVVIVGRLLSRADLELVAPDDIRPVRKMVLMVPSGGLMLRRR